MTASPARTTARPSRPTSRPTRRSLFGGAAAVLATGAGTSACGRGSGAAHRSAPSRAAAGFPVTVTGQPGPVTVPKPPGRVVACGYLRDTDIALALGAPLVGCVANPVFDSGLAPWQEGHDLTVLPGGDRLPFEKIAALAPDLILAADDYGLDEDFATLSQIAPTLGYARGIGRDSWQTMTARAAQTLGRAEAAADLVTRTEDAIAAARANHPELRGRSFTFGPVNGLDEINTVSRTTDAVVPFFEQLGMKLSPTVTSLQQSSVPGRSRVSLERLDVLEADVLVLTFRDEQVRRDLESRAVFRQLPAVRRGAYVALDLAAAVSMGFPSVASIPYGLRTVVPKLSAAVKATR